MYLSLSEYIYIHDDLGLFWITGKICFITELIINFEALLLSLVSVLLMMSLVSHVTHIRHFLFPFSLKSYNPKL